MFTQSKKFVLTAAAAALFAGALSAETATSGAVRRFADGSTVEGASSTLVRSNDSVTGTVLTTLSPDETATIWWVVFNKPENCSDDVCDDNDVLPPPGNVDAGVSVIYATGRAADMYGKAEYGAKLMVGDMSKVLFGPGLQDIKNAEIHMVVRSHGPRDLKKEYEQISTFNEGCPASGCVDIQFAIHMAQEDVNMERLERIESIVARMAERMGLRP